MRTFLSNGESCVRNNGHSKGYFLLKRGTRQGDPLSAYLFILCVESLFNQIPDDENIKEIFIGDYEIKLSAYADDADFLALDVNHFKQFYKHAPHFNCILLLNLTWISQKHAGLVQRGERKNLQ